jgi:hypothetical protein
MSDFGLAQETVASISRIFSRLPRRSLAMYVRLYTISAFSEYETI